MVKIIGFFWLIVFLAAIAGFVFLGLTDVSEKKQDIVIDIPAQEFIAE